MNCIIVCIICIRIRFNRFIMKLTDMPSYVINHIDNILDWLGEYYIVTIAGLHVLYISLFFGFLTIESTYIRILNVGIQFFIGLFLVWRFHPLRTHEYKKYDSRIIFGSGIFLLTNLGFFEAFKHLIP
jgi:hypothetical protein